MLRGFCILYPIIFNVEVIRNLVDVAREIAQSASPTRRFLAPNQKLVSLSSKALLVALATVSQSPMNGAAPLIFTGASP